MVVKASSPVFVPLGWLLPGAVDSGHGEEAVHQDDVRSCKSRYLVLPDVFLLCSHEEFLASVGDIVVH